MPATPAQRADFHVRVNAFETARRRGPTDLAGHLPPADNARYLPLLTELVRLDLEYGWQDGTRPRLVEYVRRYPELASDRNALSEVAFEEYRQRADSGDRPTAAEYARAYAVDTAGWDSVATATQPPTERPTMADEVAAAAAAFRAARAGEPVTDLPDGTLRTPVEHFFYRLNEANPADADSLAEAIVTFPAVGTKFLGFHLLSELGRGAFARVYLAEQVELGNRRVALKVTPAPSGEPQTLAQLQHTNIVPIYSVHRGGSHEAICMPYFGATTLATVLAALAKNGPPPSSGAVIASTVRQLAGTTLHGPAGPVPADAAAPSRVDPTGLVDRVAGQSYIDAVLGIAGRLAEGLAHAHARGILHRDIKPANVLLGDDGTPMLLDFNLAGETARPGHGFGGTLAYMAPEHLEAFLRRQSIVDERSDVYELGLVIYELLAGRPAFPQMKGPGAPGIEDILTQRRAGLPSLRKLNSDVSPAVDAIVRKCVHPDPAQRYQSADDFREDLDLHAAHRPLRFAPNTSVLERLQKWARRHPRLSSSGAIAAVALSLVAVTAIGAVRAREANRSLAARQTYRDWEQDLAEVRAALYRREPTAAELDGGIARGRAGLARYGVLGADDWQTRPPVTYLPPATRDQLRDDMGEALFLLAKGAADRAGRAAPADRNEMLDEALDLNRQAAATGGRVARAVGLQRAGLLELRGDPAAADARRTAEAVPAESARDRYLYGHTLAARGEFDRALPSLIDATRLDPESFPAWFVRGQCHFVRMQFDQAAECFTACLALRPTDGRAWQNRGLTAFRRLRMRDALADLDRAVEIAPDDADLRIDRAAVRMASGQYAGAETDLTAALDRGSRRTRVYFMRAIVRDRLGHEADAAADRATGRQLVPTDVGSWLARAEDAMGRDSAVALAAADEALRLDTTSSAALQLRAGLLMELGRTADADRALDRAVALYPDHAPFWCGRGVHNARLGRRDRALADAREALARDTSPPNLYQAGCVFALTSATHSDDRAEALRLVRAAIAAGFGAEYLATDPDLNPIRKSPEFAAIEKLAARPK